MPDPPSVFLSLLSPTLTPVCLSPAFLLFLSHGTLVLSPPFPLLSSFSGSPLLLALPPLRYPHLGPASTSFFSRACPLSRLLKRRLDF